MGRYIRIGFVLVILLAGAVTLPRVVSSDARMEDDSTRAQVRTITFVVRNMTYYLEGSDVPNPSLRFTPGEQVRLTLRNEDRGMTHDFAIKDWGVTTKVLEGKGEDTVLFRVPVHASASVVYSCNPHSAMMNGSIVVE